MSGDEIVPFRIGIGDDELEDLRARLRATRWPPELSDASWSDGADPAAMRRLVERWAGEYDWRVHEAALNESPQFVTIVDGQRLHFVHERSSRPDAIALLLLHGWPSSFVEFRHIVKRLANPSNADDPAFHVVVPSLPGFGFSSPTTKRGWASVHMARPLAELMARLGYTRYGAHGADIGYALAGDLARQDPAHVMGIHLALGGVIITAPHMDDPDDELTDAERRAIAQLDAYRSDKSGYALIQGTRPETVGYALTDSPIGQLAWIAEKFHEWSDPDHPVHDDDLLTNVTLYWLTRTAGSAARFYKDSRLARSGGVRTFVDAATGIAAFPHEIVIPIRRWTEEVYNVVYWADMPAGGHFAPLETPDLVVESLRHFYASLASG